MNNAIQWARNTMTKTDCSAAMDLMAIRGVEKARRFHSSFPQYNATPLVRLSELAHYFGVGGVYIKDESLRFGLNSFKVLGGSFAMARFIAAHTGRDISELDYGTLIAPALHAELGDFTFYAATDGNHGRCVAWAARQIGQKAVVFMPWGTSEARLENIRKEGAEVSVTSLNYDEAVRLAVKKSAETPRSVVVQDTAWEGYEDIPGWIMQGYGTMGLEAAGQLAGLGITRPTHVFIQAGVGTMAASMAGLFANMYPEDPPVFVVVEASAADCFYRSAARGDGGAVAVGGVLSTIMAGLACGTPNPVAWRILKNKADFFVSLPDYAAAKGMRMLGAPLRGDARVISGESGASSAGLLAELFTNPACRELRGEIGLDAGSQILLFSTEGDTDPEGYRRIVWDGDYNAKRMG